MENLKMSDLFVLPTVSNPRLGYNIELVRMEGCPNFRYEEVRHLQMKSLDEALAVSNAINNHDRLVEENAELRKSLEFMVDFAQGQMHPEQNDPSMFDDEDFGNLKYAKQLLNK